MPEVLHPTSFEPIFVSIDLNGETVFFVVFPFTVVTAILTPFFAFEGSVFCFFLFFHPVDGPMGSVLLSLSVVFLPQLVTSLLACPALYIHQIYNLLLNNPFQIIYIEIFIKIEFSTYKSNQAEYCYRNIFYLHQFLQKYLLQNF